VNGLVNGKAGCMVGELKGDITFTPLRETWDKKKELDSDLLRLVKVLAG
jgi:6-phosphofructokinase 1